MKAFFYPFISLFKSAIGLTSKVSTEEVNRAKPQNHRRRKAPRPSSASCASTSSPSTTPAAKHLAPVAEAVGSSEILDDHEFAEQWAAVSGRGLRQRLEREKPIDRIKTQQTKSAATNENKDLPADEHWTQREMRRMKFTDDGVRTRAAQFLYTLICSYASGEVYHINLEDHTTRSKAITKEDIITFTKAHPTALKETSRHGYTHLNDILNFTTSPSTTSPLAAKAPGSGNIIAPHPLKRDNSSEISVIMSALCDPLSPRSQVEMLTRPGHIAGIKKITPADYLRSLPPESPHRKWIDKRAPSLSSMSL